MYAYINTHTNILTYTYTNKKICICLCIYVPRRRVRDSLLRRDWGLRGPRHAHAHIYPMPSPLPRPPCCKPRAHAVRHPGEAHRHPLPLDAHSGPAVLWVMAPPPAVSADGRLEWNQSD